MRRRFGESESRFIKSSDLLRADGSYMSIELEISHVTVEELGEGRDKEERFVLRLVGKEKGLVLNKTNEQMLVTTHGDPGSASPKIVSEHFSGKHMVLYYDPTVSFGGQIRGGLRLRPPDNGRGPVQPPQGADFDQAGAEEPRF